VAPLRHIVLFRFHDGVGAEERTEAVKKLRGLGDLPGILSWRLELSTDARKGNVVVQNVLFGSSEDFAAFRSSRLHEETGQVMSGISDWLVADYEESP
jgi:heme-degrading monooxygenase HmoA